MRVYRVTDGWYLVGENKNKYYTYDDGMWVYVEHDAFNGYIQYLLGEIEEFNPEGIRMKTQF